MLNESEQEFIKNNLPFYNDLTTGQLKIIKTSTQHVTVPKGQQIYNNSSECLGLILVLKGILRSYLLSQDGREVTLYRLWTGDCCILSASCLLDQIEFDILLDSQEDSEYLLIGTKLFHQLMEENVKVKEFTSQMTNHRFSDVMWMLEQIFFMSLDQRIAVFLIDESKQQHTDTLYMTHAEIASCIGSAREAVSRMLKYMQEEDMIETFRGGVHILNYERLYQLAYKS